MERRWSVPIISALVALLAVVLVAPGLDPVTGAIPNKGGMYSACLTKKTGAVKVINYPKVKCAKGQRLIKWSQQGPAGPAGPQGPQGTQGPPGPTGIANVTLTRTLAADLGTQLSAAGGASPTGTSRADCPAGGRVVGGGYNTSTSSGEVVITQTFAEDSDTWYVAARNTSATNQSFRAYAVCMSVQPDGVLTVAKKAIKAAKVERKGRR